MSKKKQPSEMNSEQLCSLAVKYLNEVNISPNPMTYSEVLLSKILPELIKMNRQMAGELNRLKNNGEDNFMKAVREEAKSSPWR